MANQKISQLALLTKSTVATNDLIPIVDTSAAQTKAITYQDLIVPQDNQFMIANSADNTKLVAFSVAGLTTGNTRTLTVPDASGTLILDSATQTLINKTLTAPQINMGGDATGDIYYRNALGQFTRLAIGATGTILEVVSGLPAWVPNPAASNSSTTVAGVVQLATTADITAGNTTGSTGAQLVIPASAVGPPGANKIVQLDSSGKLPALNASQLTNIPFAPAWVDEGSVSWTASTTDQTITLTNAGKKIYMLVFNIWETVANTNASIFQMQFNSDTAANYTTNGTSGQNQITLYSIASTGFNACNAFGVVYIQGTESAVSGNGLNVSGNVYGAATSTPNFLSNGRWSNGNSLSSVTFKINGNTISGNAHIYSLNI